MENLFQPIADTLSSLKDLRVRVIAELQSISGPKGSQLDLSANVPGANRSLAKVDARILSMLEIASCTTADSNADLVPMSYVDNFKKPLDQILAQYQEIANQLRQIKGPGGGIGHLDPSGLSIQSQNGEINLQLGSIFQTIWNNSEKALSSLYPLIHILGTDGFGDFSSAHATLSKIVERVQKERKEFDEFAAEGEKLRDQLAALGSEANSFHKEISRLKSESDNDRKSLGEYASEGTEKIGVIRTTNEQAEQLRQTVESYQAKFTSFQNLLSEREQAFKEGTNRQRKLIESVEEIEARIVDTIERSENMLSGATVAGLASSFGNLRNSLSGELESARKAFYWSIALLFVSVIPLMAYVFPVFSEYIGMPASITASGPHDVDGLEFTGQVITRALLLIPAAWFAKFAAARHAALFRLREHYAYKYSVASSVDGFKKQAEPYRDEIAAATFFQLTVNPGDKMESKGGEERHPNPIMDGLMKKMGFTHDGKS